MVYDNIIMLPTPTQTSCIEIRPCPPSYLYVHVPGLGEGLRLLIDLEQGHARSYLRVV